MKKIRLLIAAFLFTVSCFSQPQDAEGCKDHPMFNRLPDFVISQCSENFASLDVVIGKESQIQTQEGTRTHVDYLFNADNEQKHKSPSWLQVTRNYENAILKLGGKKLFSDNVNASYRVSRDGKDIYVMLSFNSGTELQVEEYLLDILEKQSMKQDITANDIYSALNSSGSIALYINFETGKSDIKPESQNIINQIADMLNANKDLKISVEGHTDNVGTASANKILSENRAKAVMNALIAKGIDKSRLTFKGWGQEKPVADNSTDDGRAKNRRVEIVKM